jgi:hypothetical protein
MRLMSGNVLPASRSMEDNVRSRFDEGGERYSAFRCSMQSLLWRIAFEISLHVWNFCTIYVFCKVMMSSRKVINAIF